MWDHDCGCVPVVNDSGTIQGMITPTGTSAWPRSRRANHQALGFLDAVLRAAGNDLIRHQVADRWSRGGFPRRVERFGIRRRLRAGASACADAA